MEIELESGWKKALTVEIEKPYFKKLTTTVKKGFKKKLVYPPEEMVFNALKITPLKKVRVVILGQDPYHGPDQAHGLSFSVPGGVTIPPSLRNIYKELNDDVDAPIPLSGNLQHWAEQGVLLLNSILTVEKGQAGSHKDLGWENFTDTVIETVSREQSHVVFLLWGKFAQSKKNLIDTEKHLVLEAAHPSPFSANSGFLGSKHFSQTNEFLKEHGLGEIMW